ncbi:hypothetical protein GN956_G13935 [Arapaima gigas]
MEVINYGEKSTKRRFVFVSRAVGCHEVSLLVTPPIASPAKPEQGASITFLSQRQQLHSRHQTELYIKLPVTPASYPRHEGSKLNPLIAPGK